MMFRLFFAVSVFLSSPVLATATEIVVSSESGALAHALQTAKAGDVVRLQPGIYHGPIEINKALTLDGGGRASIIGTEVGSVISVMVPDVTIKGLTISGSGSKGNGRDAGVYLSKKATNAVVSDNRILGNLVGVDIHGSKNALVTRNVIEGRQDFRMNDRGNGVYVWNAPGAKVVGNDIRWGRDGIFVNASENNQFADNRFRDLRFAVHYMYAHHSRVTGNISIGNHLGYAIMYSDHVVIEDNYSRGDRDHGIMMNYTNSSKVINNHIEKVDDKCVFIYNAHKNIFEGNLFSSCGIGIHFTAGSERNRFSSNAFVGNRTQVKYVGSKWIDWSVSGKGNYWSDHGAFDLDGDGVADTAYRPNDIIDHILWTQPAAKFLLGTPAVQLIRWSQSAFPALLPGGVVDRAPLMQPVLPTRPKWED